MRHLALLLLPLALLTSGLAQTSRPARGFDHTHGRWNSVLAAHVQGDRFDYAALKKDRDDLDGYLQDLGKVSPGELEGWTRDERFVFWVNAYNAFTIQRVVDNYPIESIRDIGTDKESVWDQSFIPLGRLRPALERTKLSLNDIEHKILRPEFKDARVHAAVNCASRGCPPLAAQALKPERLGEQLDDLVRAWLADPGRNRYQRDRGRVEVSRVFEWFVEDFAGQQGGLRGFLARYAPAAEARWIAKADELKIDFLEYDWRLNDTDH
jgi:hypothetical protein